MKIPFRLTKSINNSGILNRDFTFIIKLFCCLLVGLHHFARIKVEQQGSTNIIYILLASQGGNVGVGLFFFLSGYGLMESFNIRRLSFREILIKRFWRLFWPLLIINIIFLFGIKFFDNESIKNIEFSLENIINFKKVDGVLWFIEVLCMCYIIFYASMSLRKYQNIALYGGGVILIVFYVLTRYELHWHYTNIPMFFLGVAYSQLRNKLASHIKITSSLFLILGISVITVIGWFVLHTMWARLGVCLITVLSIILFNHFYTFLIDKNKAVKDFTYEYYLTHNKLLMVIGGG